MRVMSRQAVAGALFDPAYRASALVSKRPEYPTCRAAENRGWHGAVHVRPTAIATRNLDHIDPVTAVPMARRTVLPSTLIVLRSEARTLVVLHGAVEVAQAMEEVLRHPGEDDREGIIAARAESYSWSIPGLDFNCEALGKLNHARNSGMIPTTPLLEPPVV